MRKLVLFWILLTLSVVSNAQGLVTYGLEWGYSAKIYDVHHFNYRSEDEGYIIDEEDAGVNYATNALMLVNVGVDVSRTVNVSVHTGFAGISKGQRVHPLSLRLTFAPKGCHNDGILMYLDGGMGFRGFTLQNNVKIAKLGCGYRWALGRRVNMDLLLSGQGCHDQPVIWDKYAQIHVKNENIRLNRAGYISVNLTVALSF